MGGSYAGITHQGDQLPFDPASRFWASGTSGRPGSASYQISRNYW